MKTTKIELVKNHLLTHKRGITSMVAWNRYNISSLRDVIYTLRKQGWEIESIPKVTKDGIQYRQYILKKKGA